MSADNGVYILKTPRPMVQTQKGWFSPQHGFEYRVAHCMAIDNIDYSDLYLPVYFGDSEVFLDKDEAFLFASNLAQEIMNNGCPLEYGVSFIEKPCEFPNMTSDEASHALNTAVFGEDMYKHVERTIDVKQMDTDIRLRFPSGKEIVLQWRIENGHMDICIPEDITVITWKGEDMESSEPHESFPDGHVRTVGQMVLELGEDYLIPDGEEE